MRTHDTLLDDHIVHFGLDTLLKLLVPLPHPSLEVIRLEALARQPELVHHLRLVLQPLDRDVVHRLFQKTLTGCDVFGQYSPREYNLPEMSSKRFQVERDFTLSRPLKGFVSRKLSHRPVILLDNLDFL